MLVFFGQFALLKAQSVCGLLWRKYILATSSAILPRHFRISSREKFNIWQNHPQNLWVKQYSFFATWFTQVSLCSPPWSMSHTNNIGPFSTQCHSTRDLLLVAVYNTRDCIIPYSAVSMIRIVIVYSLLVLYGDPLPSHRAFWWSTDCGYSMIYTLAVANSHSERDGNRKQFSLSTLTHTCFLLSGISGAYLLVTDRLWNIWQIHWPGFANKHDIILFWGST